MIEMGILTGLGIVVILVKANVKWRTRLLNNPVKVDIAIFLLLYMFHGPGTFAGAMVATVGALVVSMVLSLARRLVGYTKDGVFVPGYLSIARA